MHSFEYYEPRSLQEAAELLLRHGDTAKILAGGTDLIVQIRNEVVQPQHVINIKTVPGLNRVTVSHEGVEVGASASMFAVEKALLEHPEYKVLREAIHTVACCQIRNRATLAGNICNASPAADTLPALYVLDAQVKIFGAGGERIVPVDKFMTGPRRTVLAKGEVVASILLPRFPETFRGVYIKKSRRPSVDLATVSVAACWDGKLAKIALGAVAPTVVRASEAENVIGSKGLNYVTAADAAKAAVSAANPISDLRGSREYRLLLVEALTERALLALSSEEGA